MSRIRLLIHIVLAVASLMGLVLGTLGFSILFSVDLPGILDISERSRQLFVIWSFIVLLVSWILFYLERMATIGELRIRLTRKRDLQKALDGLAKLRSEGIVELFAKRPKHEEYEVWENHFFDWEKRVIEYMNIKFTLSITSLVSELGLIPTMSFTQTIQDPKYRNKHEHKLQMINKILIILERVIIQNSAIVIEPKPTFLESLVHFDN